MALKPTSAGEIPLLKGTTGANGSAGSQILSGTGAPPAGTGVAGDYFMSTDTYLFYGPKTEAGWGLPVNPKGSKGDKEDPGNAQAFSTEWITFSAWAGIPSDFLIAECHPAPAILSAIGAGSIKDFMDRNGIILAYLSNYLLLMSQYQFPGDFQMFPPVSQ